MNHLSLKHQKIVKTKEFTEKICLFSGFWKVSDCNDNPKSLFLYGDNDQKKGKKGQAVIRDCVNAIGIPTKKYPSNNSDAYFSDDEYDDNCKNITSAFVGIIDISKEYDEILFPCDGFGTGLAQLSTKAPNTFAFLNQLINQCFGIDYPDIIKNGITLSTSDPKTQELTASCNMACAFNNNN